MLVNPWRIRENVAEKENTINLHVFCEIYFMYEEGLFDHVSNIHNNCTICNIQLSHLKSLNHKCFVKKKLKLFTHLAPGQDKVMDGNPGLVSGRWRMLLWLQYLPTPNLPSLTVAIVPSGPPTLGTREGFWIYLLRIEISFSQVPPLDQALIITISIWILLS